MTQVDDQPTRAAPHSVDAEEVVLGLSMLGKPGTLADVRGVLAAEDFYLPSHDATFAAVCAIADQGVAPHPIVVAKRLAGGPYPVPAADLTGMMANAPGGAIAHAQLVRELADCRRVIDASNELREAGYTGDVDKVERVLNAVRMDRACRGGLEVRTLAELVAEVAAAPVPRYLVRP